MPAWPTVTDDTGDKISGTIFNKALTDAMKAYLDGLVVATGPGAGVTPAQIVDEVVTARGTKASLDARLDVALNEDGTPKAVAGQATETQVARQLNGIELARNRWLTLWSNGATVAPDFYSFAGAGAPTIQQCGVGLADTTQIGVGRFTARVISDVGNAATLSQTVIASTEMDDFTNLRNRKINFAVRGQASSASIFRLIVTDGVNTTTGDYNTTGSAETLAVSHTIASTATSLQVSVEVKLGTNTVYIGGFSVTFGDVAVDRVEATVPLETYRVEPGDQRLVAKNTAGAITGANPTFTWAMPANTLSANQSRIFIEAAGAFTANANNKAVDIYVNTHTLRVIPNAAHNVASNVWLVRGHLFRVSNTSVGFEGIVTFDAASAAAPTVNHISALLAGGAVDFTTAMNVQVVIACGAGDGTLSRVFMRLEP